MINKKDLSEKLANLSKTIKDRWQRIPNRVMKNYVMLVLLSVMIVLLYFTAVIKLSG